MAPASLPAFAAMSPGPSIPSRTRQRGHRTVTREDETPRFGDGSATAGVPPPDGGVLFAITHTVGFGAASAARPDGLVEDLRQTALPPFGQQDLQHVVHCDYTHQVFVLLDDGQRDQVVSAHHLGDLSRLVID